MEQLYSIKFNIDYRGLGIDYEKVTPEWLEMMKEDGEDLDERFEVTLQHPTAGYKVYWACEFPNYSVDMEWSFPTEADARNHMLKIYSQINDRLPFVVTGHNSAYKEQGHYPKISEELKNMDAINLPFEMNSEYYYFMILVDTEKMLYVLPLTNG